MLSTARYIALVAVIGATTATAGLAAATVLDDDHGPFQPGTATAPQTCMEHQRHTPEESFASDSARNLTLLRYYTANGNRPYCDRQAPTSADAQWARLHLKLGGNPESVRAILAPG
ncbi:hypothetical protein [Actinomadura hibisca]|uniref:hypothetical protein n=1 Tax=Actinomadura hibisca TaxID=68565 RepID=UPI0008377630|nr:hypothetical protein [Actinomadura hibisca]